MDAIASRQNSQIKQLVKWHESARERRKSGVAVLEGIHLVQSWCDTGRTPAWLVAAESALGHPEVAALWAQRVDKHLLVSDALFSQLFDIQPGVGLVAVIAVPVPQPAHYQTILLLDDIQDPLNVGGILRTAAAAGVEAVYLSNHCADAWSPKVLRGAMGGHWVLAIHEQAALAEVIRQFDGQVVATSLAESRSLYAVDLTGPVAWIMGNEGAGVSQALMALTTTRVRIPMPGRIESLNVAAATAVCLFEQVRQRQMK
ncbi:TrmH family RNA methyltransferase [Chitinivorax tropicus]|uniref:TrmH family RNA methyltransferase n=1 Tax=Chitinivorax tropicus TaxID=714531 RepID=A0A840MLN3_9PROT|nr:RNA methyltransferase [Chitinivorax tropicus]MBB5019548.1 TrmH family RNA methyltransferase [Chitinivorax tropicus]